MPNACAHVVPHRPRQAAAHYNIPLDAARDFPLQEHLWSLDATVWARYLQDKVSPKTADEYRGAVFAAQTGIASKDDMLSFTRKFFQTHGLQLPFVPDPTGQFKKEVEADRTLGDKAGSAVHAVDHRMHAPRMGACDGDRRRCTQTIDELDGEGRGGGPAEGVAASKPAGEEAATVDRAKKAVAASVRP